MAAKKRFLVATLPDGYVKTIGPTAVAYTHYWRIVAHLPNGKTEVFWGHAKSRAEANKVRAAASGSGVNRGWKSYDVDIVELTERLP